MIPDDRLEKLKQLFVEDGITITDKEALEIGLWVVARVRSVLQPLPLDKLALFATIKDDTKAMRHNKPFVNLYEWRREKCKINKSIDVSPRSHPP